jgi:hypothetical protein
MIDAPSSRTHSNKSWEHRGPRGKLDSVWSWRARHQSRDGRWTVSSGSTVSEPTSPWCERRTATAGSKLTKVDTPTAVSGEPNAPANTLGTRHIMFAVEDIEDVLVRLQAHGAELVGEASSKRTAAGSATYAAPRASSSALGEQLG